ncbi:MAG: CDP-alcohol phosphatidyltransferase family protein [Notoacmeibacter sp.]|nr:CDP-alcohol phosphatidyltransferase family protein [Notoacmeibacter sp.]
MLDGWARQKLDPLLDRLAAGLSAAGASANAVTIAGAVIGLLAAASIGAGMFPLAIALILLSRLSDGLDGAIARIRGKTDFGGYLDIVLDFLFYGAIPLAFIIYDPSANAVAGATLILSFYVNGASFLAYAVMAEKRALESRARGEKSLFFTTGLAEATETIAVFVAMCLVPAWFAVLAWVFAAICFYTAVSRIVLASRTFVD